MEREGSFRRSLHNKLRLGTGPSSSLTDLSQAKSLSGGGEKCGSAGGLAEECSRDKGTQQRRAGANATWNSIHNAVISVFQRKDLGENELYTLNEGVRQLLKTELGSFFTEYLQNQLLTKGMVILRDKIRYYEGQKLLDSLADTWDFFFCDVLSMLQAIFCPVQGKEPSVRQLALLHFRNIITLNLKLDEALARPRARVPPSIIQMLLILQGVHESKGVTDDYLRLESLIQKVVSPYLGTHGLYSRDESSSQHCSSCLLEKRLQRSLAPKPGNSPTVKNPVVRSKSYNVPMLTPLVEYDIDPSLGGITGIRRHSVCEISSCLEESSPMAKSASRVSSNSITSSLHTHSPASTASPALSDTLPSDKDLLPRDSHSPATPRSLRPPHHSPCILPEPSLDEDAHCTGSLECDSPSSSKMLAQDTSSGPSPASSLEMRDHTTASFDSEQEADGIFLNFSRRCSGDSTQSRDSIRQSVA
ncbi:proline-rich protein 5-like isoform X2 [Cololabis saira]|uniref:proline-rich protein 5-like isoform X2 n=1 Tax=Cololabis saira TaxID=129043 RepID=UPI002AD3D3F1|nr:proline-rich protein 5-like isoform X2 [Cololabis saira]XP_061570550.1 proline-rich protein 5-like isoform X2 [Cololabis saira]